MSRAWRTLAAAALAAVPAGVPVAPAVASPSPAPVQAPTAVAVVKAAPVMAVFPAPMHTIGGCYNFLQGSTYNLTTETHFSPKMTIPSNSSCRDVNVTHIVNGNWAPVQLQVRGWVIAPGCCTYPGSWFTTGYPPSSHYHDWHEVIWDIPNGWTFYLEFKAALGEVWPIRFNGAI